MYGKRQKLFVEPVGVTDKSGCFCLTLRDHLENVWNSEFVRTNGVHRFL
jgi:hypothetical protein